MGCNGSSAQAQAAGALVPLKQPLAGGAANGTDGTAGAGAGAGAATLSFGTGVSCLPWLAWLALSWAPFLTCDRGRWLLEESGVVQRHRGWLQTSTWVCAMAGAVES